MHGEEVRERKIDGGGETKGVKDGARERASGCAWESRGMTLDLPNHHCVAPPTFVQGSYGFRVLGMEAQRLLPELLEHRTHGRLN